MKILLTGVALAGLVIGASAMAGTSSGHGPTPKASDHHEQGIQVAHHTHRHRHCHVTLSLGHLRRKCHTHHHNRIVHHGPQFH